MLKNNKIYALQPNQILLKITCFDANNDHYMDFDHVADENDTFESISQKIQERILNKRDQSFEFMKMISNNQILEKNNTPFEFNIKNSNLIIVYCQYIVQYDHFYDYFRQY